MEPTVLFFTEVEVNIHLNINNCISVCLVLSDNITIVKINYEQHIKLLETSVLLIIAWVEGTPMCRVAPPPTHVISLQTFRYI